MASSDIWSRRDSWPPTQVRLALSPPKKSEPRPLLEDIDENPLTYFLTPSADDNEDMDDFGADDMLFDAGIEDSNNPPEIVRSVSPSTLDGLSKLRAKSVSPDLDSDVVTTDDEGDDEDYIRFSPPSSSFLTPFRSISVDSFKLRSKSPPLGRPSGFLSPTASFPAPSSPTRGRPRQALTRSFSAGSRLPPRARRLWREPSPDVWSIEEETEEDLIMDMSTATPTSAQSNHAKPKKKVRFLLPARE
ncbi:uncharacterized protein MAM_01327 [Metarhizium album ARSEF 1941]|uniref:Uncharacterized protein n=1 Tax=Metarhizium album (strain ARSEF 1941) TaxID=1081103 RepID=A0A0B2X2M9_METAS|nr:uncharacterized protein MAM_01327 [Metarhizium album ARSEF 1941]KHO00549.1 hypothetical protein MAM_01327 [Metarhizium album ARSEF 1941]